MNRLEKNSKDKWET